MAEYVTLLGAEEVSRAANTMNCAAADMQRAAASIESTLQQFSQRMDEWVSRLEALAAPDKEEGNG